MQKEDGGVPSYPSAPPELMDRLPENVARFGFKAKKTKSGKKKVGIPMPATVPTVIPSGVPKSVESLLVALPAVEQMFTASAAQTAVGEGSTSPSRGQKRGRGNVSDDVIRVDESPGKRPCLVEEVEGSDGDVDFGRLMMSDRPSDDQSYMGRDPERLKSFASGFPEDCPASSQVLDFAASRNVTRISRLPYHMRQLAREAPRAWTLPLEEALQTNGYDANFIMAYSLTLQAATAMTHVMAEKESHDDDCIKLRRGWEELKVKADERSEKLAAKNVVLRAEIEGLKDERGRLERSADSAIKEAEEARQRLVAQVEKVRVLEEKVRREAEVQVELRRQKDEALAAASAVVDAKQKQLADTEDKLNGALAQLEEDAADPRKDTNQLMTNSYIYAGADILKELKKAKQPTTVVEKFYKEYVLAHPLDPQFYSRVKELEDNFEVDLSWWPDRTRLIRFDEDPPASSDDEDEGVAVTSGGMGVDGLPGVSGGSGGVFAPTNS